MITVTAPAKLNLFLHVTGKRSDGYHLLDSIFVFTAFGDELTFIDHETLHIEVVYNYKNHFIAEQDNLIRKAALLLQEKYTIRQGAYIKLLKNIPIGGGLGGGSSDAASALIGLNKLWKLNLSLPQLHAIAIALGADVAACLYQRPLLVSGIGEIVTPVSVPLNDLTFLLVNPNQFLSTQAVFKAVILENPITTNTNHTELPTDALSFIHFLSTKRNDLEKAAVQSMPEIGEILNSLREQPGCCLARMSGSGSTCFGLFFNHAEALSARDALKSEWPTAWAALTTML